MNSFWDDPDIGISGQEFESSYCDYAYACNKIIDMKSQWRNTTIKEN